MKCDCLHSACLVCFPLPTAAMPVEDFIALCHERGFHFTARWITRRYNELVPVRVPPVDASDWDERYPFRSERFR